ncbi:CLUMA_CG012324, isoform A [Clunio marinus]|uniref:CLUMA_CG012324, isoform A n=1 Tax=Clunio marinus TaxID=568069 RepID=A0A1J1IGA4_9DIPT|nr:CLUMA_CG012324, isoform A [Clunio marinus]
MNLQKDYLMFESDNVDIVIEFSYNNKLSSSTKYEKSHFKFITSLELTLNSFSRLRTERKTIKRDL